MEPQSPDQTQTTTTAATEPWHAPLCKVTPLSKILAAIVFITLPFVGFWLGMGYQTESTVPVEVVSEDKAVVAKDSTPEQLEVVDTDSVATVTEGIATTTVTAYIISIDENKVVLDYIDILSGQEAIDAATADGKCALEECLLGGYDRNVDPQQRTLVLAADAKIYDRVDTLIPLDKLSTYTSIYPQKVTLNSKNEVVEMTVIFRP